MIQECENPKEANNSEYTNWAKNHLWIGDSKHKGLGIFAREEIILTPLNWTNEYDGKPVKHFLSCRVNLQVELIAVWTHYNESSTFGYIGQLWKYLQLHKTKFTDTLIVGDFNSNSLWDKPRRGWNHSIVVKELEELNIYSLYHSHRKEISGCEISPTVFLQKNLNKPYHIDYIFGSEIFRHKLKKIQIGKVENWIKHSDHLPMIGEFWD